MNLRVLLSKVKKTIKGQTNSAFIKEYCRKFSNESFIDCNCKYPEQFEASIIRLYHTIEKGLSYKNYRAGFGKENINKLITTLEQYASKGFDLSAFFYETALSCLEQYLKKNKEYGWQNEELEKRIRMLPGNANCFGGTILVSAPKETNKMNYEELIKARHSIRTFSDKSVRMEDLNDAIKLAQYTPSACNRQGWKTRVVIEKNTIKKILDNQNGNRGFGDEFDKLLIVTAELRAQQRERELFQAFIDGGMYAENLLNSLYYKKIGSVPLSASLTHAQEMNVRKITGISDSEVLILFIGIGEYPDGEFLTTRSERKPIQIDIIK